MNGIVVAEEPGPDTAIARRSGTVTAFVGRTLRGPVDRPVTIHSYADFHQIFGGLWQPSTLSYAVEQFYENGGRDAVIVRVANGGRPATMSLPCGGATLILEAQSPGSRESLRASVDYDNIGPSEEDRFNLVVQRVRTAGSEHIEDQEIFRRVSCLPGSTRFVATALQESTLVKVRSDAKPNALAGRLENLVTGSQCEFASGGELLEWIASDLDMSIPEPSGHGPRE